MNREHSTSNIQRPTSNITPDAVRPGRWMLNVECWMFPLIPWRFILCFFLFTAPFNLLALEPWRAALAQMPLKTNVTELTKTNCIPLMLASFQEDQTVKAFIFMPGATDEFYFFNRGYAQLDQAKPTLLDAVNALEKQTALHATFRAPFLLIHSAEDPLDPVFKIEHEGTAERIRKKKFTQHAVIFDQDWDSLVPGLSFHADTRFLPPKGSSDSWHFYRHSFASWNLSAWEALEAISLAGKTIFTVQKKKVVFEGDKRFRSRPAVPSQP